MPAGRVDIQDFMVVCPGARKLRARRSSGQRRSIALPALLMQERGARCGVADEGGWWPDFATNEQALEAARRAIERAGFVPGEQVAIALDIAASEFGREGRYALGLESRELDSDGMGEMLLRWVDKLPDRLDRGPVGRGRPGRFRALHARVGHRVQIVGDDFLVSHAPLVREAARSWARPTRCC